MIKNKIQKNFIWNIIGTTFNSFNSLFFMIVVTRINGISDAGIFTFAFSTACLFYVIGTYSGRTFQVTDNSNVSDSDYFYSKIGSCFLMFLISGVFCLFRRYSFFKIVIIMILVFYKLLEALSESFYAIIQKKDELDKVGKSLFLKAIISLILFVLFDLITKNLLLSTIMIVIANMLIIIIYDLMNLKKMKFKLKKINYSKVLRTFKEGFFSFGFTFLTLYVINAPKYSIDSFMSNSAQTIFGIIIMPATIIVLFSQFVIQPFLVKLKSLQNNDKIEFKKFVFKLAIIIFIVGIISILFSYVLGIPILELLYGIKLSKYLLNLIIIISGATLYGVSVVFSTALTTMRKTFCQFIVFLVASVLALILSNYLVKINGIFGATISYFVVMLFLLLAYIIIFLYQINKRSDSNEKK